jgi:alpha-L-rhamnosidase
MKILPAFLMVCLFSHLSYGQCVPENLRCEYLTNPLGVDVTNPRLSWLLNDDRQGALQTAYRIVLDTDSATVINKNSALWDSGKTLSNKMTVAYSGKRLNPFTKYYWSISVWDKDGHESTTSVSTFETGVMDIKNWKGVWISDGKFEDVKPAPYFRKEFEPAKKIKSARAYIAVAGLYELYINGEKIGDHRLDPMFTRFDMRNLYVTYDVTKQLKAGRNAVGVLLGNGWYNHHSNTMWRFDRAPWRNRPAFCMDLRITYEDGSIETIVSERDWKTHFSPVTFNSIYTAEHYDARLEIPGWNTAGFDDTQWAVASFRSAPSQNIVSQQLHPIRNVEKIPVKSFKKINDRKYIFDLGRNIAGVSQLRVSGEAGTEIKVKHAEILRPDNSLHLIAAYYNNPADSSDLFATDIYILSGKGEDTFMPYFNYKGFQYVEVTSDKPINLTADNLTGWFMHSDLPPIGQVETSNPLINKIWFASNNSYLSNMFGYPTDCPHREKLGWTGDGNYAVDYGLYNFDGITVYEKWMADHRDEQQPNGIFPNIIPTPGIGYDWANGPDWTGSCAIIPWAVYEFYGDSRLLADSYESIKRFVDYLIKFAPSGIMNWGLGDWIPVKSETPMQYTSTIYYYRIVNILAKAAKLFGKTDDYANYSAWAEKIKTAFNAQYLNRETGIYDQGFQTELSAALHWGMVPEAVKAKVIANLAKRVEADNNHVDVGMLGSKTILHALSDNGYADLAYTLASQETHPAWGYWMVKDTATTIYEFWHAIGEAPESSLNHVMFGEISAWFYKSLGGINIDPEHPGFENILLKPHFVKGLNHVSVSYQSPYGKIVSEWERKKKTVIYKVTIPANSSATLYLQGEVHQLSAGKYQFNLKFLKPI